MMEEPEAVEEVLYVDNIGATELFNSIEDTEWDLAEEIARAKPEQVSTWVRKGNGTEDKALEWSTWRRLPLHEVSRALRSFRSDWFKYEDNIQ